MFYFTRAGLCTKCFLIYCFVKLSYPKCYHATKGSFPDINIVKKMNCLTLSKVSMWWRERGWRGKAINNNKKRLPNIETEISRWKFVMAFPREPKGKRSREVKGKREESKSVESCLRVTCKLEQSQILHLTEQAIGGEGKLVFLVVLYWKMRRHPQDLDFSLKYRSFKGYLSIAASVLDTLGIVK